MLEWIRREPVGFADFAKAAISVIIVYLVGRGILDEATAASIIGAVAMGLAWFTRAAVVPVVKMTNAAIAKADAMTKADIAELTEKKSA